MGYYAGLDVSMEETWVCIMDQDGKILHEGSVPTHYDDIAVYLNSAGVDLKRVGLEAGPTSSWLYQGLLDEGLPVICIDARHANAALKAQNFKTDKNDARGLAHIMRTGWYRVSHVKSLQNQKLRVLINTRKTLVSKRLELDNQIRGTLKSFGMKMGAVNVSNFEERVRELLADEEELMSYMYPLLRIRSEILEQCVKLDYKVQQIAKNDELCKRLMTIPGVGVLTSLLFKCTIDNPHRFKKSTNIGVHIGLTPRKYASGEIDYNGRITKCGDRMLRNHLYEAAQALLRRTAKKTALKEWGQNIAKRSCRKCATVAVARKIAIIMHRVWVDGTEFCDGGVKQAA